ncbi:MAG TPA: hypothetical protein VD996_13935 [Chitinophagaceae bacterium]|nr:hypothetical protein [Chitinophagaceae bacterium]
MRILLPLLLCFAISVQLSAQNVAINADGSSADASAALHIKSTTKGLLIPTMTAAQRAAITSPATGLMVYQTDGSAGFYYNSGTPTSPVWTYIDPSGVNTAVTYNASGTFSVTDGAGTVTSSGRSWLVGGNNFSTTGQQYNFGTTSNDHVNLVSNNVVRGRLSNLGEFFIGTTSTALSGDLLNSVGNATFPWAINGYTSFNGGGVYGSLQGSNTSLFGGVQGENNSTSAVGANTAGVRGINSNAASGTGFRTQAATGPKMGVVGNISQAGTYAFGVHGSAPGLSMRTGGMFGDDGGIAMGAVGYYASNGNDYSFYGFGRAYETGAGGGRVLPGLDKDNTHIGLGVHGGVMGGWIKGLVYGAHVKGERYGLYVDGNTYTNKPITQLIETQSGERIAAFTPVTTKVDVTSRGKSTLQGGSKYIAFDAAFKEMISSNTEEMTITVTPNGNSNGVYVSAYDHNGFWVKENNNGQSNVAFTWIAISTRKGYEQPDIATELLARDFDQTLNSVMHNESNTTVNARSLWWDGTRVRFDAPPAKKADPTIFTGQRPQTSQYNKSNQ